MAEIAHLKENGTPDEVTRGTLGLAWGLSPPTPSAAIAPRSTRQFYCAMAGAVSRGGSGVGAGGCERGRMEATSARRRGRDTHAGGRAGKWVARVEQTSSGSCMLAMVAGYGGDCGENGWVVRLLRIQWRVHAACYCSLLLLRSHVLACMRSDRTHASSCSQLVVVTPRLHLHHLLPALTSQGE